MMTGTESGGATLKRLREDKGMSRHSLAVEIGVTESAIQKFEVGENRPRRNTAEKIDEALDAHGAVLSAFGFSQPIDVGDRLDELQVQIDNLRAQVDALSVQLTAAVDRRPAKRQAPGGRADRSL